MSMGSGFSTIQCPNCHRTLPPAAQNCHFCGASLTGVARPVAQKKVIKRGGAPWIWTLYYIIAVYWMLEGLVILAFGIVSMASSGGETVPILQAMGVLVLAIGAFITLLGLGLILKWEWCRGVVNFFCWLHILFGLLRFARIAMLGFLFFSPAALIANLFFLIVGLAAAGLQIWVLSETD